MPPRGLLHHGSTLACAFSRRPSAVHFCGTILRLATTGRYPAPCPAEPGLSSRGMTPPAIVCQTSRLEQYTRSAPPLQRRTVASSSNASVYRKTNGSVEPEDAYASRSQPCSAECAFNRAATAAFMICSI